MESWGKFKKILVLIGLASGTCALAQQCPVINAPTSGSANVPVDVMITWPPVSGIIGYSLTLGTFPGGGDILTRRSAGLTNSFIPPVGLPENTRIYVTISMFLGDGQFLFCNQEMYFDTEDVTTPPPCTRLSTPLAGAINADNEAEISWDYAPTATGYRLSYNPPQNLPPESDIYVRIVPYNENGTAGSCREEQFTTGAGGIDCGPFRDPITGQSVRLGPELTFPDAVGICLDALATPIRATDNADGYRW